MSRLRESHPVSDNYCCFQPEGSDKRGSSLCILYLRFWNFRCLEWKCSTRLGAYDQISVFAFTDCV